MKYIIAFIAVFLINAGFYIAGASLNPGFCFIETVLQVSASIIAAVAIINLFSDRAQQKRDRDRDRNEAHSKGF